MVHKREELLALFPDLANLRSVHLGRARPRVKASSVVAMALAATG